jgi:hypothetical protein
VVDSIIASGNDTPKPMVPPPPPQPRASSGIGSPSADSAGFLVVLLGNEYVGRFGARREMDDNDGTTI